MRPGWLEKRIAGVDEAGRGPLAGPVVACAVMVGDTIFKSRIDDSKRLTPPLREKACSEILEKTRVGVGIVDWLAIDRLNILRATQLAIEKALTRLHPLPGLALIDGNMKFELPYRYLSLIHGDRRSFSIACASIVAKVTRDGIMLYYDSLYPQYGFAKHKGYPTRDHLTAIKRYGPSPIHRKTFRPVRELLP